MSNNVTYQVNLRVVGEDIIGSVTRELEQLEQTTQRTTKSFGDCFKSFLAFSQALEGLSSFRQDFENLLEPGRSLNANMMELSAITGVTGNGLKAIEKAARETAKTFGTSAVDNVEAYKMMLSQLSPEIANNAEAMRMMGENANILSKQMGGDTVAATEVLNTSLNQFGVSMDDPIAAAKIMADMMNVMSAAAQQGSAELPQIKQALEQVGMVAKTTGLSFAETNAYIQLLDQAGKKGSEGGVALRNVLTTLSEGRFTSKLAAEGLKQAGISVDYLADSSIPLHERLKTLRKIQGDTALMTKVFGKENMAAAIAMINTADEAEAMTKVIVGTNSAVEQAEVIMEGYNEKVSKTKAWFDDLKIAVFNFSESFTPFLSGLFMGVEWLGKLAFYGQILTSTISALTVVKIKDNIQSGISLIRTKTLAVWTGITSLATKIYRGELMSVNTQMSIGVILSRLQAGGIRGIASAFSQATIATRGFSLAMLNIPVLGWIAAGIMTAVVAIKYLWENSRRFREILFGVGYAGRAVFHNLGVYASRVWKVIKTAFQGISEVISGVWNGVIKPIGIGIFRIYRNSFMMIWNVVKTVFNWIVNLISKVWNWIKTTFSEFASWLQTTLIDPIYEAFSKVWDWLDNLFGGIVDKLGSLAQPIKDLWNSIFSSEGTINVKTAYEKGEKKGRESFDRDQKAKQGKSDKPQEVKVVDDQSHKNIFDVGQGLKGSTGTIGGVAAEKTKKKKGRKGSGDGESDSGNKVRNLTVGKMVENLNIYTQKGTVGESKEQILQALKEIFGTAVSDFAGADRHATTA